MTGPFRPLPRADGEDVVVIQKDVWNRLCDMVEAALSITVHGAMTISQNTSGTALGSKGGGFTVYFGVIASWLTGGGLYEVRLLSASSADVVVSADLPSDLGLLDTIHGILTVFANEPERGLHTHTLPVGTFVFGHMILAKTTETPPRPVLLGHAFSFGCGAA